MMTAIKIIGLIAALGALALWSGQAVVKAIRRLARGRYRHRRKSIAPVAPPPARGFPHKKAQWVVDATLALHENNGHLSHRKLADLFNQLHAATDGVTVGRTWVRELLIQHARDALQRQRECKHRVPPPMPANRIWAADTTGVTDASNAQHAVLGIVDHGTRLNLALRYLKRFNAWTFLGCVMIAIGEFGKPDKIRTDNHPVFHSKWVKRVLLWIGVRQQFTRLAHPWENGIVERFFGTFKACVRDYVVRDAAHLASSLAGFSLWYNMTRPHQHLGGCTPYQVWCGIDPYRSKHKSVSAFSAWGGQLTGMVLRF